METPKLTEHGTLNPSTMGAETLIVGLLGKRSKMFNEGRRLRERMAELGNDVAALDRVLASLGYEGELDAIMPQERSGRMFSNGSLMRTCFDEIRARGPLQARDIAIKIMEARGDDIHDRKHLLAVTANVSRCLRKERARGMLKSSLREGNGLWWEMVQR